MSHYDTQFFERYAKNTLEDILGDKYSELKNKDRPDLQDDINSIGIEVTRAMQENKFAANAMLLEMEGLNTLSKEQQISQNVQEFGYSYGISNAKYVGDKEYEYWKLAKPLLRIIDSKVEKFSKGYYEKFLENDLYIFIRIPLSDEEVLATIDYIERLQKENKLKYDYLFISEIHEFNVCNLITKELIKYPIDENMCKKYFFKALIE